MVTFEEARQIAENTIDGMHVIGNTVELIIDDIATIEKPYAWIFYYNSKRHIEIGDIMYALGGNAPLFISKVDGQISTFSTGLSIDQMIEQYEEMQHIWKLILVDNIYADVRKLFALKQILNLSSNDIIDYKKTSRLNLDAGSRIRMLNLQKALRVKKIYTEVIQRALI